MQQAVTGAGRVIAGRYELLDLLGRGAMGTVWRAHDPVLAREVAIKEVRLPALMNNPERQILRERTLREARVAGKLNHPSVVTVYDVVEADGNPWIVMELVPARSLERVVAQDGPLPARRVSGIGVMLLEALASAHAAGIVHRDVKPANVLITGEGRAVLTDFGIATLEGEAGLTQAGMVMGTPGFCAPERIRGEPASPASDLWSLGATLFAAVEGRAPYHSQESPMAVVASIVHSEPPRADSAGPLCPVIGALMSKDPARRPDAATAARMLAAAARMDQAADGDGTNADGTRLPDHRQAWPGDGPATGASWQPGDPARDTAGYQSRGARATSTRADTGSGPTATARMTTPGASAPLASAQSPRAGDPTLNAQPLDVASPAGGLSASASLGPTARLSALPGSLPGARGGAPARHAAPAMAPRLARRRGGRSRRGWLIAAAAGTVVLCAGLLAGARGAHRGTPGKSAGAGSRPAKGVAGLPAGYRWHTTPADALQAGYSMAVPRDWSVRQQGTTTLVRDPAAPAAIKVMAVGAGPRQPLAQARLIARRAARQFPGYRGEGVTVLPLGGAPAASLRFSYTGAAGRMNARVVVVRVGSISGHQLQEFMVTAPAHGWRPVQAAFEVLLRTFRPLA